MTNNNMMYQILQRVVNKLISFVVTSLNKRFARLILNVLKCMRDFLRVGNLLNGNFLLMYDVFQPVGDGI